MAASDLLGSTTMRAVPGGGGPMGGSGPPVPRVPVDHGPKPPVHPSTRTTVRATVGSQLGGGANPLHPWEPWTTTVQQAEVRARQELTVALALFNQAAAEAGKILDTAQQIASQAAGQLEDRARAEYERWMTQAAAVQGQVMDPAQAIYDQAMTQAADDFNKAITTIGDTFRNATAAANKSREFAATFPAA